MAKNEFLNWEKMKNAKNVISRKKFFDLFDFTSFLLDFFKFSGPLWRPWPSPKAGPATGGKGPMKHEAQIQWEECQLSIERDANIHLRGVQLFSGPSDIHRNVYTPTPKKLDWGENHLKKKMRKDLSLFQSYLNIIISHWHPQSGAILNY